MDLVYSIVRKQAWKTQFLTEQMEVDTGFRCLAKISANNIVAWVTAFDLDEDVNIKWGSHVYITDLNVPWKYHKITSNKYTVTTLEWDMYGTSLLIGDKNGFVSIWTCTVNHSLTDWVKIGSEDFRGEPIIAGAFFHLGKKIMLINEDSVNYLEKFKYVHFAPSVRSWGGTGHSGCLVVSATGMIGALLTSNCGEPMISATNSLDVVRYCISVVDISYRKNGNVLVATSDGHPGSLIHCYDVSIKTTNQKSCLIVSRKLPSICLTFDKTVDMVISNVKFTLREGSESLVIGCNSSNGCTVETWELFLDTNPSSKVFEKANTEEEHPTVCWIKKSSFTVESQLTALTTPKTFISYQKFPSSQYVLAAFSNHKVCCFSKELTKQCFFELSSYCVDNIGKTGLQHGLSIQLSDLDISYLGNVFVVCDNMGNLYLFQLKSVENLNETVVHATLQLEYCLLTGFDWWDLAISLRPNMLEAVCNRFSQNFQKQQLVLQQKEYTTYLSILSFLYKIMPITQSKRSDLMHLMMLQSISNSFKNQLHVTSNNEVAEDPVVNLSNILKEPIVDIDTIVTCLGGNNYLVEPVILQSFYQLIKWVAQLALNVVSRIPEPRNNNGYNLLNDFYAINKIRELLILIRVWVLSSPNYLPIFDKNIDNVDILSITFRLLSRFVQLRGACDKIFFDECHLLQSQVNIIPLPSVAARSTEIASPALYDQQLPLKLVFGQEPDCLRNNTSSTHTMTAQHSDYVNNYDVIRNVYIGKSPLTVKECVRCKGKMQVVKSPNIPAVKVWENRWVRNCRCGGRWRTLNVEWQ